LAEYASIILGKIGASEHHGPCSLEYVLPFRKEGYACMEEATMAYGINITKSSYLLGAW